MANITKVDPFTDLFRFEPFRDMEELFPNRLRRFFREMRTEPTIRLDVSEDDKAYHVKAELPGVKKEDISVEIDGNQVSLAAEAKFADGVLDLTLPKAGGAPNQKIAIQ